LPSGRDARGRITALPPALRQRCWAPGQSGNPSGKGGVYHEMQRLAREFSPEAVAYLIEIARDGTEDTRNRIVAMSMLLERAWGRSQPFDPAKDGEEPLRHLKLQASLEADKLTPAELDALGAFAKARINAQVAREAGGADSDNSI
jgi:hypothetical protein